MDFVRFSWISSVSERFPVILRDFSLKMTRNLDARGILPEIEQNRDSDLCYKDLYGAPGTRGRNLGFEWVLNGVERWYSTVTLVLGALCLC